jgi:KDO2-lipid IV(A) lauroyltransferase
MARRRNPVSGAVAAGFTLAYLHLSRLLPLSLNRAIALRVGRMLARLVPRVRKVTMANLDLAYGDSISREEKERIYRGAVDNVCLVAAEFSQSNRIAEGRGGVAITVEGTEFIEKGRGYVCIGAHISNWELMGPCMAAHGYDISAVVREFDSPRVNRLIDGIRRSGKVTTIPKDNGGREIIRRLREGALVGILVDQSPRENGVPVTFFGRPCWATVAPAMIAVRAKTSVVPAALTREPSGGYRLRFYAPITFNRTGDLRADLIRYTQACQDALERMVRENPEQWLWLHQRWKARPRLAEEWARKPDQEGKDSD